MGTIAARQAREILENVRHVIAIEMLVAAQGLDFLKPLAPGSGVRAAYESIRNTIPHLDEDRVPADDIAVVYELLRTGTIVNQTEKTIGRLLVCLTDEPWITDEI